MSGAFAPKLVRLCSVEGCGREHVAVGLCDMHYRRQRRRGSVGSAEPRSIKKTCRIQRCEAKHYALGLCKKHHQRQWNHGDTELHERIPTKRPLLDRVREHISDVSTAQGCLEWTGKRGKGGYGQFWFDGSSRAASRAVWIAYHGPIPQDVVVRHRCDNPPCVNIDHLELGTAADNSRDMVDRGRSLRGDRNPSALYGPDVVEQIRAMRADGASLSAIAISTGVSKSHVQRICRGESWADT